MPQVEIIAALAVAREAGAISRTSRVEAEISGKVMVQSLVEEPRRRNRKDSKRMGEVKTIIGATTATPRRGPGVLMKSLGGFPAKGNSVSREMLPILLREEVTVGIPVAEERADRTVVFIGPTGVGKTTTLAKLAARYALNYGEKVGLVTIDHYRIGAVDQLRAYAEIIDLPLEVAYSPRDLSRALVRLQDCDRILVDT